MQTWSAGRKGRRNFFKKVADWLSFGINSQDFDDCMQKKVIENQDLPHLAASHRSKSGKKRLKCVFNSLQRKVQTNEFQTDAKIKAVLDNFMGLIQRRDKRLVSLDRLVSLEPGAL